MLVFSSAARICSPQVCLRSFTISWIGEERPYQVTDLRCLRFNLVRRLLGARRLRLLKVTEIAKSVFIVGFGVLGLGFIRGLFEICEVPEVLILVMLVLVVFGWWSVETREWVIELTRLRWLAGTHLRFENINISCTILIRLQTADTIYYATFGLRVQIIR